MGAWSTKLAHKSSHATRNNGAEGTGTLAAPKPSTVAQAPVDQKAGKTPKKEGTPPPAKKPKNKHNNNSNNNNNNKKEKYNNSSKIHGKKPKLNSISMGDLVPNIKKILPKGKSKKHEAAPSNPKLSSTTTAAASGPTKAIAAQGTAATTQLSSSDFPALPSTSNWPSLAAAKAPPASKPVPIATSPPKKAATPKVTAKAGQNNNKNTHKDNKTNNNHKKRKNQSQQQNNSGKGNSNNTSSSAMKVDQNHMQAQFLLPPGKSLDPHHMQAQFMGKALGAHPGVSTAAGSGVTGGGGDHGFMMMRMMQDGQVVKGRQRIKPRKKRFTALKRKILLERLKVWKDAHPEEGAGKDGTSNEVGKSQGAPSSSTSTVCVYGFASLEELEDPDEYEEVVDNLKDMADRVGNVKLIFIPRSPLTVDDDAASERDHPSFVKFSTPAEAMAARGCWDGLVIGGQTLVVVPLVVDSNDIDVMEEDGGTSAEDAWQKSCLEAERNQQGDAVMDTMDSTTSKVLLIDVLTEDDLEDDDCFAESIQDIKHLVDEFGTVEDVQAKKQEGNTDVIVVYKGGLEVATRAAAELQKLTLGGSPISAQVLPSQGTSIPQNMKILMENVLTEDDLEDADCLEESLQDVRSLLEQHGSVSDIVVSEINGAKIVVAYNDMTSDALKEVVSKLNGVCLGGQAIKASLIGESAGNVDGPCIVLRNLLTEDDLEDDECLEESMEDVRELAQKYGSVVDIHVERLDGISNSFVKIAYSTVNQAEAAAREFDGMIIGGETVSASLLEHLTDANISPIKNAEEGENDLLDQDGEPKPMFSGDKRIPERFAACKRVPKVPNKGTPRHYALLTNNDIVKPLLVEMLGELMRLQLRALHDKNAKNAKARRRIVIGLREVARGIRANKVKMVVMANNLDEYGAIDDKLQEILDLAAEKEVPVLFELSKRVLGKALSKKIKVGVCGIQGTGACRLIWRTDLDFLCSSNISPRNCLIFQMEPTRHL